ncbi:phosphoadenylyl-sulfate reductase [bacterium]|nr:phosphoadenylyl-sulfate reductase [bacterium]
MDFDKEKESIAQEINRLRSEGKSVFTSSSFQTHSIPLLHILSEIDHTIPVYFLNTGFHFAETIAFKHEIEALLGINVIDLHSGVEKIFQKDEMGRFFYASDTSYCCHINKVLPMEQVLKTHDVWVAGVRKDQNSNRSQFAEFEEGSHGTLRYHPILDWTSKDIFEYRSKYNLPENPLEKEGYLSVGCEPCTTKFIDEFGRSGRWQGTKKDECGLHVDLVKK